MQLWCLGPQGPDGQLQRARFDALDAGVVAAQAAFSFVPEISFVEELSDRILAVEKTETNQRLERGASEPDCALLDAASVKRTRDEIEHFRLLLAETSHSLDSLQLELRTKAGQVDTSSSLELLRREIIRLDATTVEKHQLVAGLATKLDRRDLGRIAAMIANGELDGINTSVNCGANEIILNKFRLFSALNFTAGCCKIAKSHLPLSVLRQTTHNFRHISQTDVE